MPHLSPRTDATLYAELSNFFGGDGDASLGSSGPEQVMLAEDDGTAALYAELEKYCGGTGSKKPGPCPKGREAAHVTMRAHANAATKAAATAHANLKKAETAHARLEKGSNQHANNASKIQGLRAVHATHANRARRLNAKAGELERQHLEKTAAAKAAAAAAKPKPAPRPRVQPSATRTTARRKPKPKATPLDTSPLPTGHQQAQTVLKEPLATRLTAIKDVEKLSGKPYLLSVMQSSGIEPKDWTRALKEFAAPETAPKATFNAVVEGLARANAEHARLGAALHPDELGKLLDSGKIALPGRAVKVAHAERFSEQDAALYSALAGVAGLERFSESSSGPIKGAPIFERGTHRDDKTYTDQDLDDIVGNFRRYSVGKDAILPVPTVLGHEEDQQILANSVRENPDILQRTDQPSVGWPDRIYHKNGTLYADYDNPPDTLHKLLKNGAYKRISSEIYDEPPKGHPGKGKVLRRIALLGGDQPQIKTLGDILRVTDHAESGARFARFATRRFAPIVLRSIEPTSTPGLWRCFSEVQTMADSETPAAAPPETGALLQQLADKGGDTELLKGLSPEQLAEVCRMADSGGDGDLDEYDDDTAPMSSIDSYADDEELPEPKDDDKEAHAERARKMGERAKRFAERARRFMEKYCQMPAQHAEPDAVTNPDDPPMPTQTQPKKVVTSTEHHFSEADAAAIAARVEKAVLARLKPLDDKIAGLDKFAEERRAADTRARIDSEIKAGIASGRILPSEVDAGKYECLYDLPATGEVVKFSEGGKTVSGSKLDKALSKLRNGPILTKFGEKLKDPHTADANAELAKVEAHANDPEFSKALDAAGKTAAEYIQKFSEIRKQKPTFTAEQYGVSAGVR